MRNIAYVCLYEDYLSAFSLCTDDQVGRICLAMMEYGLRGTEPKLTGVEQVIWPLLKNKIDRDIAAYRTRCQKNRINGAKGGRPRKDPQSSPTEEAPPVCQ